MSLTRAFFSVILSSSLDLDEATPQVFPGVDGFDFVVKIQ